MGQARGPEPLAVQRLYFNVYLLQRETAFGFEPLMRKKKYTMELKYMVVGESLGGDGVTHDIVNRSYN